MANFYLLSLIVNLEHAQSIHFDSCVLPWCHGVFSWCAVRYWSDIYIGYLRLFLSETMEERFDSALIEIVPKFCHLYDKNHTDYKNTLSKANAWESIGALMQQPAEFCEQRWTVLRNKYTTEKRKIRTMPSGSGAYKTEWVYYKSMSFLDQFVVPRRTHSNVRLIKKSEESAMSSSSCDLLTQDENDSALIEEYCFEPAITQDAFDSSSSYSAVGHESSPAESHKRETGRLRRDLSNNKMQNDPKNKLANTIQGAFNKLDSYMDSDNLDHEHFAFAKSVAFGLQVIKSNKDKYVVKAKILELLGQYAED